MISALSTILSTLKHRYRLNIWMRFMRLNRPVGIWLLLWPCWWAVAWAATPDLPGIGLLILFGAGAIAMRSVGCMVNDLIDKDFDARVERTKNRPLASGELTSAQALMAIAVLSLLGALILFQMNKGVILLGIAALLLVVAYPFMKRLTYWPQAFLGLTFNWGALMGWMAVTGSFRLESLLLYAAGICWTLGYDTVYAFQDTRDDMLIGVKSTALLWGENALKRIGQCYAVMMSLLWVLAVSTSMGWLFYMGWAVAAFLLYQQVVTVDLRDPEDCYRKFSSNIWIGMVLFLAIVAGR